MSNPPYIRNDERTILAPEIVEHEPAEALFSGEDGLDVTRRLIQDSFDLLRPAVFWRSNWTPNNVRKPVGY